MNQIEAILRSLEDINNPATSREIFNYIIEKGLYDFKDAKTPEATISARLGDYIRTGDIRFRRIKGSGGTYLYYLAKKEQNIESEKFHFNSETQTIDQKKRMKQRSFDERDLHKLLVSYLKNSDTYSKTIFHELSNGKENNQIWTHPDMVGIKFLDLQTKASQNFLKSINRVETFKLSAYELKKEINNDSDLKKAFFQTVSNSSWANYGYLVAFEFSDNLMDEMARLNQSFGIGIIELKANPYQSKVVFPPVYRDLDFKTIDKLCRMNKEFEKFIEQIEKIMTASEKYFSGAKKELEEYCDKYFVSDSEVEEYCKEKHILTEEELRDQ